jgi:acyl-CoA thioesterase-2
MPRRESLYARYPDYRVDLEPNPRRVQARLGDAIVADSRRTLTVRETRHDPVVYFPREDVRFELLERTDHRSFCPFKGEASYWTVRLGERAEENVAWGYEDPFEQVAGLEDHVAFYADRIELIDDV